MIKHKLLTLAIMLVSLFAGISFISLAIGASYSGSESVAEYYPEEDKAEFIDDSEEEKKTVKKKPKPEATKQPGSQVSQEDIIEKLEIPSIDEEQVYYFLDTIPNDVHYPQWYLDRLQAAKAWDISTGVATTTVAVIDSGYALDHEDLDDAWAINGGETGQTQSGDACWTGSPADKDSNSCDDDGNGYVDDWRGWDFSNVDNNPQAGEDSSGASHGTKVAGLVGAEGNNATGVAALNWNTEIMPLQGLFDAGYGYTSDIVSAVIYAVDNGADVINLSLGGPSFDSAMNAAVEYAYRNNVIVVAAAGNCGDDPTTPDCIGSPNPGGMLYPGRYNHAISVGATNSSDAWAGFSSFGPELDFAAPGSGTIQTTTWTAGNQTSAYATSSYGTSFSSPIVASLVALIKAELPNASYEEVYAFLKNGVNKVSGMNGNSFTNRFGWGRINAFKTLQEVEKKVAQLNKGQGFIGATTEPPRLATTSGHTSKNKVGSNNVITWCVTSPNTMCSISFKKQGSPMTVNLNARTTDSQGIASWSWRNSNIGSGTWDVTVTANGQTSEKEVLYIN